MLFLVDFFFRFHVSSFVSSTRTIESQRTDTHFFSSSDVMNHHDPMKECVRRASGEKRAQHDREIKEEAKKNEKKKNNVSTDFDALKLIGNDVFFFAIVTERRMKKQMCQFLLKSRT